jgi:hypothetical protein
MFQVTHDHATLKVEHVGGAVRQISLLQSVILSIGLLFPNTRLAEEQHADKAQAEIVDVAFCDLVTEPSKYDGKVVRVNAIYFVFHHDFLYHPDCGGPNKTIHPRLDCDSEESCKKLQDSLSKNASVYIIRSRTSITAVGKFKGPGDSNRRYGVGSGFQFELDIKHIEKAFPTPPDTPGPQ